MAVEIKIPSVGESVKEAVLAEWYKKDGEAVQKDDPLFVIETDKVTLEVNAEADGVLKIGVEEGETVAIGAVVGQIETGGAAEAPAQAEKAAPVEKAPEPRKAPAPEAPPAGKTATAPPAAEAAEATEAPEDGSEEPLVAGPSVRRLATQYQINLSRVQPTGPGGRITKGDVILFLENRGPTPAAEKAPEAPRGEKAAPAPEVDEPVTRKAMSPIRRRIAERLLEAKQSTAMLTTFNDVDMSAVMDLRERFKDPFKKKYGVSLGFMSFFIKAAIEALQDFPGVNAFVEDKEIVYHDYYHMGIAIGTGRGLVVPVIRHADRLSFAGCEQAIVDFVTKIKQNRLELSDLEGGTFTITNGGVFGSLLSTPILNTPQSGILGMHRIDRRPMAIGDKVEIRPMMYIALSYDHRIVDGREAVTFLKRIKECVENPERIMMEI